MEGVTTGWRTIGRLLQPRVSVDVVARERIYTKKGDDGTTGLFYGGRVRKDSELPRAYGTVDEAQAVLGLARSAARSAPGSAAGSVDSSVAGGGGVATGVGTGAGIGAGEMDALLVPIMRDLWVLMAELATLPANRSKLTPGSSAVTKEMVDELERRIDELDTRFEPPTEFVVPGEHPVAAWLDLARTVVRRAERHSLVAAEPPSLVVPYLNRLSDLLWTMARWQEGGDSLKVREV